MSLELTLSLKHQTHFPTIFVHVLLVYSFLLAVMTDGLLPLLLKTLSDGSDAVVLLALEVLARVALMPASASSAATAAAAAAAAAASVSDSSVSGGGVGGSLGSEVGPGLGHGLALGHAWGGAQFLLVIRRVTELFAINRG